MALDKQFEDLMNKMYEAEEERKQKELKKFEEEYELETEELLVGEPVDDNPLTTSQNKVMQDILTAITFGAKKILVQGSAGVGKTFMVQYLIKEFRKKKSWGRVQITAPTNRAVSVLLEKQKEPMWYMEFMTIHKALFLKRKINDKTGEVTFPPDYNPKKERPFKGVSLLIIDEASMLNSLLLYYLESYEYRDTVMIFLGDNKQLNPVGEPDSPIFLREGRAGELIKVQISKEEVVDHFIPDYKVFTLTEIIRQAEGNPIIHLSYNLHEIGLLENNLTPEGYGYDYSTDFEKTVNEIITMDDRIRYLAWTNNECNDMNTVVRKRIYTNPHKVELGETIIFGEPYEGMGGESYWTNYELKIETLEVKTTKFTALRGYRYRDSEGSKEATIEGDITYYWINKDVMIVHESSMIKFFDITRHLVHLTKFGLSFKAKYAFQEQFARFGYRYALTVHKAQGGTFDKVILNMRDINKNRTTAERNRLWYTGLTRASKNVTIYNPPFNENTKDYL